MLTEEEQENEEEYLAALKKAFRPKAGFRAEYSIGIGEKKKKLILSINGARLECGYGTAEKPETEMQLEKSAMEDIVPESIYVGGYESKGRFRRFKDAGSGLCF